VQRELRVVITGGGTGGHIYPALAIADGLRRERPGCRVLYVGGQGGLERNIVPRTGLGYAEVQSGGLVGKSPVQAARGLARTAVGFSQALGLLRPFGPHVVCGTGGYVCVPVVLAGLWLRRPYALQEQNVFPGVANRLLARFGGTVFLPHEDARRHFPARARFRVTGNPVRREVLAADRESSRAGLGVGPDTVVLLAFGGSRGAGSINRVLTELAPRLAQRPRFRLLWVTGEVHFHDVRRALEAAGVDTGPGARVRLEPYLHDMPAALAAADLALTRAGAMTLAELTARGVPAVLVPSPNVTHNHQEHNARLLEREGAAHVILEAELAAGRLLAVLERLLAGDGDRRDMSRRSRALGKPRAVEDIVSELLTLAGEGTSDETREKGR